MPHDIDVAGAIRCYFWRICKGCVIFAHAKGRIETLAAVCRSRKVDIRVGLTGRIVSAIHSDDICLVVRAEGNGREVLTTEGGLIHEDIPGSTQSIV